MTNLIVLLVIAFIGFIAVRSGLVGHLRGKAARLPRRWDDEKQMKHRSPQKLTGVEVPRGYEESAKAMEPAWERIVRSHPFGSPFVFVADSEGTDTGATYGTCFYTDDALLGADRTALTDTHEGNISFVSVESDPADELYSFLTAANEPEDV